jgi:hypothetical protein
MPGIFNTVFFARPFCSLKPAGDQYIDEFTQYFGKPELEIEFDQLTGNPDEGAELIKKVTVKGGCTLQLHQLRFPQELGGVPVRGGGVFIAAEKFHNYPCLAFMAKDPELWDAIVHVAGYQIREAVKKFNRLPKCMAFKRKGVRGE